MHATHRPLLEPDRFFAAPRERAPSSAIDAQSRAVERLVRRCEQLRPHLRSADALDRFIRAQPDPQRVRRRLSLALAIEVPETERIYGWVGSGELEAFRTIATQRLAAVVWVFG